MGRYGRRRIRPHRDVDAHAVRRDRVSGEAADVFRFKPTSTGTNTVGIYDPRALFRRLDLRRCYDVSAVDLP